MTQAYGRFWDEDSLNDPAAQIVVVVLPWEILLQEVEAHPAQYSPETVERIRRLRAAMKQRGAIPQFDELGSVEMRLPVSPEIAEAITADASAAGRTLAEQISYEIEVHHGWRFPDPGATALEEHIRESHTIRECLNLYLRFHIRFIRAPRNPARLLLNHSVPLLSVAPSKLSRPAVVQWAQAIGRHYPSAAMHAVSRLRHLFAKAKEWGLVTGDNPAAQHRLFPKRTRSRFLTPAELARLLLVLARLPIHKETYFLTLLLTGSRRSEAATMQWAQVDLDRGLWSKPTTKSGEPHTVPLPQALQARLRQLPRIGPYVFPGDRTNNHVNYDGPLSATAIEYHWRNIRRQAGIPDVRIHDLRRTCASWLAIAGENLAVIQNVLDHSSLSVTETYARLNLSSVRAALEGNAQRMLTPDTEPGPPKDSRTDMDWPG